MYRRRGRLALVVHVDVRFLFEIVCAILDSIVLGSAVLGNACFALMDGVLRLMPRLIGWA